MPIFFAIMGLVAVGVSLSMIRTPTSDEVQKAVKSWPAYQAATQDKISGGRKPKALDYVIAHVRSKVPVPRFLIEKAMYEAAHDNDWKTFHALAESFRNAKAVEETEESEPPEGESQEAGELMGEPEIVVGKNSPLQGVSNDDWTEFVVKLQTQDPTYRDDKHVGAFHHSKRRISELGLDPEKLGGDREAQYAALEADVKDASERYKRLINEWSGDVITLNGQQMSVTRSGLYGLLKCAGFEGAKEWLTDENGRMRYPNTTAMFLNTNGLF